MNAADLIRENNSLKNKRANYEAVWTQINQYISLRRGTALLTATAGSKQTGNLFDSTAVKANRDLAAWMNNNLTSMSMEWFSLRLGVRGEQIDKAADEWLEECKQKIYDALRASNFQAEAQKLYLDLPSFCTGCMYMEERDIKKTGFNGFRFITLSPGEYCVSLDQDGSTAAVFREMELKAHSCLTRWGSAVSDKVRTAAQKKPMDPVKILHAVFPADWYGGDHKTEKPFASYYIEIEGKSVLESGGYSEFPYFVVPWERSGGEDYGNGPGWDALPDVMTLNKAKMLGLSEWALAIRPPLMALQDGVIGSVRIKPGGITVISKEGALQQFISGAKFSDNRLREEDLRQSIKEIFHGDLVKFLPPVEETKPMTAFEVSKRAELVRLLGPAFGNLTDYWLDPMIENAFYIMFRAGAFSPPPESIQALAAEGRENFKIEYEGALAKAQRSQEIESIVKTIEILAPLMEIYPDIKDNFDADEIARAVALINGMPKKTLRAMQGENGVLAIRKARADLEMEQREIEHAQNVADAANKAVPVMQAAGPAVMGNLSKLMGGRA